MGNIKKKIAGFTPIYFDSKGPGMFTLRLDKTVLLSKNGRRNIVKARCITMDKLP